MRSFRLYPVGTPTSAPLRADFAGIAMPAGGASYASLWLTAARPRTLPLSMTPVAVGAALAWAAEQEIHWAAVVAALIAGALIQVGTNLHNDAADAERGGDGPDRVGPPRVTSAGLLSAAAVKTGAMASFAVAGLIGVYLVVAGGWPILLLGILSIMSGLAYTGGPRPIAYTSLGELFVIAFFGLGAVCGTYWLAAGRFGVVALEGGLAIGCLAAAVLLVNNQRDVEADARVGRRTLAIVAGRQLTNRIYAALLLLPFALSALIARALPDAHLWPVLIALPAAIVLIHSFAREPCGPGFNRVLAQTVALQSLFGALLCAALLV